MKRKFSLIIGILISLGTVSAQVVFKPGYVVDNQGVRTECLIKDYGWLYSPEKIVYKLSEDSAEITATVPEISAFGVQGADFIRREVNVDTSPLSVDNLSLNRMPEYEKRTVFLKVLHNGDISLYEYYNERPLYFYEMGGVTVPLVYKKYRDLASGSIRINSGYREQVKQFPGAADLSSSKLATISYTATDLLKLFEEVKPKAKEKVEMAVFAGGGVADFYYQSKYFIDIFYENNPCAYAGFEAEYFFPFAARRLSAAFQPSLQYINMKSSYEKYNGSEAYNYVRLLNLCVPVAIRYNLYLNGNSRLFANAIVGLEVPVYYKYFLLNKDYKPTGALRGAFGLGYRYRHIRAELRYSIGSGHLSWLPSMTNVMDIVSFNLAYCF